MPIIAEAHVVQCARRFSFLQSGIISQFGKEPIRDELTVQAARVDAGGTERTVPGGTARVQLRKKLRGFCVLRSR